MNDTVPKLSLVILCYQSGFFVNQFVRSVQQVLDAENNITYELVLVANYREGQELIDKTPNIAKKLAVKDSRIQVVAKEKEGMMGWDVRAGLNAARGRVVAFIDGDGQVDPHDVVKAYKDLVGGGFDMVYAERISRGDGLLRVSISSIFNVLMRLLFPKIPAHDINGKPKIFTADALKQLKLSSDNWFIDAEIIIQATYRNLKMHSIKTTFHENIHRGSFVRVGTLFEFLVDMMKYRMRMLTDKKLFL